LIRYTCRFAQIANLQILCQFFITLERNDIEIWFLRQIKGMKILYQNYNRFRYHNGSNNGDITENVNFANLIHKIAENEPRDLETCFLRQIEGLKVLYQFYDDIYFHNGSNNETITENVKKLNFYRFLDLKSCRKKTK